MTSAITRRHLVAGTTALTLLPLRTQAQTPTAVLIYADGLKNGWWIGGWAKHQAQFAFADGSKPVAVTMAGWNVMTFQTSAPFDPADFSTITLLVHGGPKGKQEFKLSAKLGDKVVSGAELSVKVPKGDWARIDVRLKDLKLKDAKFDTLVLNNASAEAMDEFYINYVLIQ
ncbi:hypothetical protein Q1W73_07665 [Asticcacaulis sp. ZE23SCel15]|uniref:hypothetical protein n=1 Tax=Asticcacaulis sp. ZE23SCel15 TaxID=3059027 RepID=UPI00265DF17C|nr:hypothetical protein [Asticcacaulis sp. ZE23SCel15]WKL58854.1 hypothetical protein Q1W73_07665 [Asticcacaulis sp. ZE23SCel15]